MGGTNRRPPGRRTCRVASAGCASCSAPELIETARERIPAEGPRRHRGRRGSSPARPAAPGELLTLGESEHARYVAGQALELWRGRPLSELEAWEPGVSEAHRLEEVRAFGMEEVAVEAGAGRGPSRRGPGPGGRDGRGRGPAGAAVGFARAGAIPGGAADGGTADPAPDPGRASAGAGTRPGTRTWSRWRRRSWVGTPSSRSRRRATSAPREGVSPYPGLAAYGGEDAESFVGREGGDPDLSRAAGHRRGCWRSSGPSGSGKSSFAPGQAPRRCNGTAPRSWC